MKECESTKKFQVFLEGSRENKKLWQRRLRARKEKDKDGEEEGREKKKWGLGIGDEFSVAGKSNT